MKRLALFAVVAVLTACSAAEKAPAADSAAAAAPAPEAAAPAMAPMDSTKKESAMAPMAGDTTKKM